MYHSLMAWLAGEARATEVVWLSMPRTSDAARVGSLAGAQGPPLAPVDLRAAATRWTDADAAAQRELSAALAAVRPYEHQLDGELSILADLEAPIRHVRVLRDDTEREVLYAALAYQGFAANRYFADSLGSNPAAEAYRAVVLDGAVERPWLDAAALEPDRDATAYEIAEAPQRVAYNFTRHRLLEIVPATLAPRDLPQRAVLVVDGRETAVGPSGNLQVRPGRHLVHAELDGQIIERWDLRLDPGQTTDLTPAVPEAAWQQFLFAPTAPLSPPLAALVEAMGGEVWLATPGPHGPTAIRVTPTSISPVDLAEAEVGHLRATGSAGALGGWLASGDFYNQDPRAPNTAGTVNAVSLGLWAEGGVGYGPFHAELGSDLFVPIGRDHVAYTGQDVIRPRPLPYLGVGLGPASVAGGWLFPYHPAIGGHVTVPFGALTLRGAGWVGLPTTRENVDGSQWRSLPVYVLNTGLGVAW